MEQFKKRTFAEALHKKGDAANIREAVSKAVRENAIQSRPKLVEPIDYETFVVKNKVQLVNDPQRDMLNFPHDDVEVPPPSPKRYLRTEGSTVPASAEKEASNLLVRQAIKTYNSKCHMIRFRYQAYSGSYQQLPRAQKKEPLQDHIFEIDAECEEKDDDTLTREFVSSITKKGWLSKGPDTVKDNVISFTRQFKRRFFMLKQQSDYTYILEMYKDDKKSDCKGAIFLDLAQEVVRNTKKGKYCFEIQMNDRPPCLLAADNETEMTEWITTLNKVINAADSASQLSRDSTREETSSPDKPEQYKERSIDHPVVKYSRETDSSLLKARQEGRQNLFSVYPDMRRIIMEEDLEDLEDEEEIEVFPKPVAERFLLRLEHLQTSLQLLLSDAGGPKKHCNPEPFFVTFAIYDVKERKKISEDFHVNPNEPEIQAMIPAELLRVFDKGGARGAADVNGLKDDWVSKSLRQGIFSVVRRHSEIFLVARVEKVLQGALSQCLEPYLKGPDRKMALKVHNSVKHYCAGIGHYRMPFAWSARPLASTMIGSSTIPLYRYEGSKFTDDEIIKQLEDFKKQEKAAKLQVIPGELKIHFDQLNADQSPDSTLTSSLVRIKPFADPPTEGPTFEVEEFLPKKASLCSTFDYYVNHLYVYPLSLKYDSQKTFAKARNIACCVELRDSDDEKAAPLKRIYGLPGMSVFTTLANTSVQHHSTTPNFMEEVKLSLPVQLHDRHHLLFRFYHISCEGSRSGSRLSGAAVKKKDGIETHVGYAWMPILHDGRVVVGDRAIPVASHLPAGYLAHDVLSPGRGTAGGPDVKFVEGGRPLFRVHLHLVSTVYTQDQHLDNFFHHCEKLEDGSSLAEDMNSINKIKSLLAVETEVYVQFLPTLLNQLFLLLTSTACEDVALNIARVLIHIVAQIHESDKLEVLDKYVKYVFRPPAVAKGSNQRTVHEEVAKQLTSILRPSQNDPQLINSFLNHAAFFFDILLKSMTLFLIDTERIKMPRNERFSSDCQYRLQQLLHTVTLHITQKVRENPKEARMANLSQANFVKSCFTLMDRGYVFRLVSKYVENFVPGEQKPLYDLKFEFLRIVCSHEHYIPLSLPLMRRGQIKNFRDKMSGSSAPCSSAAEVSEESKVPLPPWNLKHDFTLSDEFRRNHYLTGLILHELKMAMSEPRDVRRSAITVLRNQLAKHSFDDRYASKSQQGRIAALYLPLITILLDCKLQLFRDSHATRGTNTPAPVPTPTQNGDATSARTDSRAQLVPPQPSSQQHTPETKKRDKLWDMIAGNIAVPQSPAEIGLAAQGGKGSNNSLNSSNSSDNKGDKDGKGGKVARSQSAATPAPTSTYVSRLHKLDLSEIRDLLLCLMYVLRNLPEDILLGWFNNSSEHDVIDFFALLGLCLQHFQYQGRKKIFTLSMIGGGASSQRGALTMPSFQQQRGRPISLSSQRIPSQYGDMNTDGGHTPTQSDGDTMMRAIQEANVSTEMGLVVLDVLCQFCQTFKKELEERGGDNHLMRTVFGLYLGYLRSSQSEVLQRHVFGAWRAFIKKFQTVLFKGSADMCGELCYEILRCCNSKLASTRREACALLYLLMRTNFEFSNKKSFTRVHLQVIISVSQLIGTVVGLSTTRFQESLALVNNYANSDKSIQFLDQNHKRKTAFPGEVRDLTKRIRTVLMATAAMKENENDPELLVDLQYSLAKSYASTPELRKTWLEAMAHQHVRWENYSEAAHCYIHIAALIAEYLKRRGKLKEIKSRTYPQGCQSFGTISPNIVAEESGIKDDSGMQDVQYTEETLVENMELAAKHMEKAQRYEVMGDIYRIVIPIHEKLRNFRKLEECYQHLTQAYASVLDVMKSGKRLLGKYFRVAFFGQTFFEEEDGKEYIYKEPKVTSLAEICERLMRDIYTDKFGKDAIKLISDSKKVNPSDLDPKYGYIQVTYVTPYFEEKELGERMTYFERHNTIKRFMFETPFTKGTQAHGAIEDQYKRRTILATTHTFPYIKKRVEVMTGGRREIVLTPIEVAIDEMQTKVASLREVINSPIADAKKLQLNLQGCVSSRVHAGPLAYAEAFLKPEVVASEAYPADKVDKLKEVFREFVSACKDALDLNGKLILTDQKEYHESLKEGFFEITERLQVLLGEKDKLLELCATDGNSRVA
ncbi:dedicator of cytokinesis protein 9-like isoform X3 [Littorina saxatilis]|uniref:dedicator of cytokinesis protein 9-like isoform X3 n=1 Tax=Littorina saxatilis TaxID=31220 RepID=UPI0038B5F50D